ncbi:hypothetical protein GCM10010909_10140 [Acidocella aquatica]|uniref:PepSY domain-containing protein n=1 Tax=Acidocella aquatica TaxID=1922313 RepID=A0ABQ6A2E6_9PROT|nr:PepSY domain-containing protein [Acidocella aquatica]GLR66334.1 hypothetical protein GCM10010909_10140 [Acidocella aquatica]
MKRTNAYLAILFGISAASAAIPAFAYTGESLAKDAKITMQDAQTIALAAQPGSIVDSELENEDGGSGLRYSFDIKPAAGGATHELGVDAKTGKLLENSVEGANPD